VVPGTALKKSEQQSRVLPPSQKRAVAVGDVITLKKAIPKAVDNYWLIECDGPTDAPSGYAGRGNHSSRNRVSGESRDDGAGHGDSDGDGAVADRITTATGPPIGGAGVLVSAGAGAAVAAATAAATTGKYLVVGDSISIGYMPTLQSVIKNRTKGALAVSHSAGNAGNANSVAHSIECYLNAIGGVGPGDVVTWNAGIHELARGQEWLPVDAYAALVNNVSATLARTGATFYFVTTTPVPTNRTDPTQPACPEGILDADVVRYNHVAKGETEAHGGGVIDLYSVVIAQCGAGYTSCSIQNPNNPHFTDHGWEVLGDAVAAAVLT
jgi:hypothetical protein